MISQKKFATAIWQIFYAMNLQPHAAANSYDQKIANFDFTEKSLIFFREIDYATGFAICQVSLFCHGNTNCSNF